MEGDNLGFVDGGRLWVLLRGKEPEPLDDTAAQMVLALHKRSGGLTGTQLAKELSVTQSAITKVAAKLEDLGIVRKEPLPVARNVKMYFLAITIIDDRASKEIEKRVPPVLREIVAQKFGGQEKLALAFLDRVMNFLKDLDEDERSKVLDDLMKEITQEAKSPPKGGVKSS